MRLGIENSNRAYKLALSRLLQQQLLSGALSVDVQGACNSLLGFVAFSLANARIQRSNASQPIDLNLSLAGVIKILLLTYFQQINEKYVY
jgi:hypothetical protein